MIFYLSISVMKTTRNSHGNQLSYFNLIMNTEKSFPPSTIVSTLLLGYYGHWTVEAVCLSVSLHLH